MYKRLKIYATRRRDERVSSRLNLSARFKFSKLGMHHSFTRKSTPGFIASTISKAIRSAVFGSIVIAAITGCATTSSEAPELESEQVFWPAPPEKARYQYIMSVYNSDNIRLKTDAEQLQDLLAGKKDPAYVFNRPIDIAVQSGRIYLIDSASSLIHVFDIPRKRYFNFGFRFEGKLGQPVGITVDRKGLIYVSDRVRNSIVIYDPFGLYIDNIDLSGIATQLAGLAADADGKRIYVVDRGGIDSDQHQLIIIDQTTGKINQTGQRGKAQGQFNLPADVAVDDEGRVYVLDSGNFRIQVFNPEGEFIKQWGKAGNGLGQFGMPRSIAIDDDNHIYVSDAQFGNVQIFNHSGQLLLAVGRLSASPGPGLYSLITGVAVDKKGHLYVLDQFFKKMDIFRKSRLE